MSMTLQRLPGALALMRAGCLTVLSSAFALVANGITSQKSTSTTPPSIALFNALVEINLFEMIWSLLAAECDELALINWEWQAADGWLGKARSGRYRSPIRCVSGFR